MKKQTDKQNYEPASSRFNVSVGRFSYGTANCPLTAEPAGSKCDPNGKRLFLAFIVLLFMSSICIFPVFADEISLPMDMPIYHTRADYQDLLICCMLATSIIETLFFRLCGYKERKTLTYVFFINLLSNLIINIFIYYTMPDAGFSATEITALETGVVLFEFLLLGIHTGWKLKIFGLLVIANALSYVFGFGKLFYDLTH